MITSKPLQRLFELGKHSMHLGLETMERMDFLLGSKANANPCIHVGGTNGKGSTTTKIAACYSRAKLKVGLYTSPHIASITERIRIDGAPIKLERLSSLLSELFIIADKNALNPSFFELMTLAAFLYFQEEKVDLAVIEVGMGGRLDATNIIKPMLSIITSLDLDHTRYLGQTLNLIAEEKAGIFKPGVPVLLGPKTACAALFEAHARDLKCPIRQVKGPFVDYETENRAIAKEALSMLALPYDLKGLEETPPCRFECFEREIPIVLDVAHNPQAFQATLERIEKSFPERRIAALVAMSEDKELELSVDVLSKRVSTFFLTKAPFERAASLEGVFKLNSAPVFFEDDYLSAFLKARGFAKKEGMLLLVTGTFYIMAGIRKALGIEEPRDSIITRY